MVRKPSKKTLANKLTKVCSEIVRRRDKNICQKCGKYVTGKNAHTSHVIPKSRGNIYRWDIMNLKLLCFHCHINWWHKAPTESGEWFKKKFPERQKYLDTLKGKTKKWKTWELEELFDKLSKQVV